MGDISNLRMNQKKGHLWMAIIKLFLTATVVFYTGFPLKAQEQDSSFYTRIDFANRWIWRGVSYSEAPVLMPTIGYKNEKLNLALFGAYPFERRAYSEIDFVAEYQFSSRLMVGFTDYFGINDSIGANHKFFDFQRSTTSHMFDIYATLYPFKRIPVSLLYSLWFWGADRKLPELTQHFSQYFEIRYDQQIGSYCASAFSGFTPAKGFYAPQASIVNVGLGLSRILYPGGTYAIPLKMEFVLNPSLQNIYIYAIVGIL